MSTERPTLLVILDGFGHAKKSPYNAITQADTPHLDALFKNYPHTLLKASGAAVGLPDGYIGNSEVGHMTIGSGRIIKQPISILLDAIHDGSLSTNTTLVSSLKKLAATDNCLHILGLLSDAGVHSHEKIMHAMLDAAVAHGITTIAVHPILDGRDTPPQSAARYLERLEDKLSSLGCGTISSIQGRFYAMDRDHNWKRTEKSYCMLTQPTTPSFTSWQQALEHYYNENITDEFIPPTPLQLNPVHTHDGIIFCNIRADRARQLTTAFIDPTFDGFKRTPLDLSFFITPIRYQDDLLTTVLYERETVHTTLKEVLAEHNKTIFSIAETEKYAHVTYFFAGGAEKVFPTETRLLIPSITAKTYKELPEMSAKLITETVLKSLTSAPKDFYLINYANPDMVGHSGDLSATIKAVETVDSEIGKLYDVVVNSMNGTLYVTADHGNAEQMFDPVNEQPHTAHTTNPVPFIMVQKKLTNESLTLPLKQLADIAPWILQQMNLPIPKEMQHPW